MLNLIVYTIYVIFLPFFLHSAESSHMLIDLWKVSKKGKDFLV